MATITSSIVKFARGTWGAMVSALAAISDPLDVGKMTGVLDAQWQWTIGEPGMRAIFVLFAFAWMFAWFHNEQERLDRGTRNPDMPLHIVCRWIARDSVWASNYEGDDNDWVTRVQAEIFSKWQMGRIEMMGFSRENKGVNYIPPAMKGTSDFSAAKLALSEPPDVLWSNEQRDSNGRLLAFFKVSFDSRDVKQIWPRRGIISRLLGKSPIERLGGRNYGGLFEQQDNWYADKYKPSRKPLDWMSESRVAG